MKSQSSYGILVISVICLSGYVRWSKALSDPCLDKISPEMKKEHHELMETCKKKLGLKELPKPDELEKNGFDDKCFAKCKLTEMKIVNDKIALDPKMLEEFLKKLPAEKQADASKLWTTCGDSLKKTMEAEGGITDANSCKAAAMLKHCFMQGVKKLC